MTDSGGPPDPPPPPPTRTRNPQAARLQSAWARLAPLPAGTWLFSRLVGLMVPYTGTIGAHVRELRPGYARVTLRDRRAVRNHFRSIHAVALANLGELASGLATTLALPAGIRGIPVSLATVYHKKARGTLTAESTSPVPAALTEPMDYDVETMIRDASGDLVATTTARWRLGPA